MGGLPAAGEGVCIATEEHCIHLRVCPPEGPFEGPFDEEPPLLTLDGADVGAEELPEAVGAGTREAPLTTICATAALARERPKRIDFIMKGWWCSKGIC